MQYSIRQYLAEDEHDVVALWNTCLPRDEISLNTFRRKVILDPNFDERGCLVAVAKKHIVGFMLSIRRRYPYYDLGMESGKGWITAFFVHPEHQRHGIATHLLLRVEKFFSDEHIKEVFVSDYTPNYFIPGVDIDAYANAQHFLKKCGFKKIQSVYGMGRSLVDLRIPEEMKEVSRRLNEGGFSVSLFHPSYTLKVLAFLRKNYPGDLFHVALERLHENPECDEILLALKDNADVVGFSHFLDERFGPFGIDEAYTGRGLGPILYYQTIEQMRKKGKRNLWLAWTTGRAKDFYHKVGLRVLRRHVIMKKTL